MQPYIGLTWLTHPGGPWLFNMPCFYTTMCPALPQDSAPTIYSSRLDGLKPSFMTSMCVGVQFTCWTRPSRMARSFPAGRPGPTVKSSWVLALSIPAPSLWCSTREQVPSHPSTMWCWTTNLPPSVPTKTPYPTANSNL